MSVIVAGHFEGLDQIRAAMEELARRDFAASEFAAYRRRPGHGLFDLLGALGEEPAGGPMVAVCVDRPGTEAAAILILSRCGAWEIERAEGEWRDGGWQDYDPEGPREILKEIPGHENSPPPGK
jgi:hypothetical protein